MPFQVYILIAAAAVMFCVIGSLSLLAHHYTLDGIKSRRSATASMARLGLPPSGKSKAPIGIFPFGLNYGERDGASPLSPIRASTGAKNRVTVLVDTDDVHLLD